jgi:hypothetical protein
MNLPSFVLTEPVIVEIDEDEVTEIQAAKSAPLPRVEIAATCTPQDLSFRCGDIAIVTKNVSVERSWLRLDVEIYVNDKQVPFDNPIYFVNPPIGVAKRLYKIRGRQESRLVRETEIDPVTALRSALVYFVRQYLHAIPDLLH